jgi:uncharacterized membrane protein (DUF106 family)
MTQIFEVFLWSILLSLVLALIYRFLTNPEEIRRIKGEVKFYREKVKKAQKEGNKEETNKHMSDMLKLNQQHMKQNMKPMFLSMIIFFIFLGWLNQTYAALVVPIPFSLPLLGWEFPFVYIATEINWFWLYILITIPATFVFRKLLGVEY